MGIARTALSTPSGPGADLTLPSIASRYSTEQTAREYFEAIRWPNGPVCPHCGNYGEERIYALTPNKKAKIRVGLYRCAECGENFTVTVGTVMEDSKIKLHKWLMAFYIVCASKTQVSALQLQRQLEFGSYNTAWFMCHRIRFALKDAAPTDKLRGTIEADETYIGGKRRGRGRGYVGNKTPVVSLVERGGRVRSQVMELVNGANIMRLFRTHVDSSANLNTDESPIYTAAGKEFASHDTVNHSAKEYSRDDKTTRRKATTNAAEGFFGNSKRSIDGTHHNISRQHTALYLGELDHKYNTRKDTDGERTVKGIRLVEGKRLMRRQPKPDTK
jgi:transposase-like protein